MIIKRLKSALRSSIWKYRFRKNTKKSFNEDKKRHFNNFLYFNRRNPNKDSLRCMIMLLNHQLEKAQTYPIVKEGYGKEKIKQLLDHLIIYKSKYTPDDVFNTSLGVIKSHLSNPHSYKDKDILEKANNLLDEYKFNGNGGGTVKYSPKDIKKIPDYEQFLKSRRSCRYYSEEDITDQEINEAIRLARTAPSACNRQPVRVHVYKDPDKIKKLIISQKSDIDWCLKAKALLIITTEDHYYRDYLERNQNMFDAGLFSMNLNLIFHNMGIGSCFKMAQKNPKIDEDTKKIGNIPESENICVLYLIGKYPSEPIIVAKSQRIDVDNILKIH